MGSAKAFPSPIPNLSDHVAAGTPEAPAQPSLLTCCADCDFVHKIGTRPPLFMLFTKLLVRSLSLRPGLLRSVLSDYIVESLSVRPLPVLHRLLATWLTEFCHGRDLGGKRPSLPHPTRLGAVYLGTLFHQHHFLDLG